MNGNETTCPQCGANWDGGDILEVLIEKYGKERGTQYAPGYGYGPNNKRRFSRLLSGKDYSNGRNGLEYWQCPDCKTTWYQKTGMKVEQR